MSVTTLASNTASVRTDISRCFPLGALFTGGEAWMTCLGALRSCVTGVTVSPADTLRTHWQVTQAQGTAP